ncbi:unnamed protein product [Gongylonema pulchrum]|uniref:Uncharacterized protein n=1 Tax=Gongylonema pulchrum TaxID=637853 RepID=A0A3P7QBW7_9BILA|nr:unnamed protein product [Gongylonema pulchrum]
MKRVRGRFSVETRKLEKQLSELTDEDDWLKDLLKDELEKRKRRQEIFEEVAAGHWQMWKILPSGQEFVTG